MPIQRRRLGNGSNGAAPTLEARITRALAQDNASITASAVAALFGQVKGAIAAAEASVETAKQRALDPTIDDPAAARVERDNAIYKLERLNAALEPLQTRYSEVRLGERGAKWRADYATVKAKRDATAEQLKEIYTEFTAKLIDALIEAKAVDQDVARINSTAPSGEHDRLLSVECWARSLNAVADNFSLMTIKLPSFDQPNAWAWPPPIPPIDVRQVVPVKLMTHPGDHWFEGQAERKAQADAEAKKVAEFYRRQQREQEDMENAQAREAHARRQPAT